MSEQKPDKTTTILKTLEKIIDNVTKSDVVEIVKVATKSAEAICKNLLTAGGKPVAIILSIAVLIVAITIPIVAFKLSPNQINQPQQTSTISHSIISSSFSEETIQN